MASKYISKLARLQPPSVFSNPLNYGRQVHPHTRTITASKCTPNLAQLWSPSASPQLLNHGVQVHRQPRSITAFKIARTRPPRVYPNSLDYGLHNRSITASNWISKHARLRPPRSHDHGLQVRMIMASKCIYTPTRSRPPSASPNWLDHGLGVNLCDHLIVIVRCTSNCSQALPAGRSDIVCVKG
jgi:hypothetical protein